MKTDDMSRAPRWAQADAVFVGATEYSGMRALAVQLPKWIRLRRLLRRAPGFRGIFVYYRFPFTFGQVVLFEDMDKLLRFARAKQHRELMAWVVDERNARAGFIRLYDARPGGSYANGGWHPEGAAGYDERFTPTSREDEGPPVHR